MPVSPLPSAVVVDTSHSLLARLQPVPMTALTLTDTFWASRRRINRETTLPSQYQMCEDTGRIDNFRRAAGQKDGPFQGRFYNDSDVYKWLEAAAWSLATDPDPNLDTLLDSVIAEIAAAQQPDGYLNTYFMFDLAAERWTNFDLHEMYCAGHLFQAAVAHYRATGKTTLLTIATRLADHIDARFGPVEAGKQFGIDGHPEVELALVELYRVTGEQRYLALAQYCVDSRGYGRLGRPYGRYGPVYHQDHQPIRDMARMAGHAVRAFYLNAGATDLLVETGEPALGQAMTRLWENFVGRQMYVTGGAGSRYEGEALGEDFELPNQRAYTETCAAIASVMWNWRLLALDGDARYTDIMELTLYNGVLSGVSLDGQTYFYQNPLADAGSHRRQPWFGTACCPPNLARTLASLPGYFYSVSAGDLYGIWVHLYAANQARIPLPDGRVVGLTQYTGYPWDGDITLDIDGVGEFSLYLRIPGWCETGATLTINGQPYQGDLTPGAYAEVRRVWQAGDTVRLSLPMAVRRVVSHPHVTENTGRVALMRGPLVYCVEQVDHPDMDVRDLSLPASAAFPAEFETDLLGGVVTLRTTALVEPPGRAWQGRLYGVAPQDSNPPTPQTTTLTAIPYYAWANRASGRMLVWLRCK